MKLNKVIKRDGSTVDYDSVKINEAVLSAFKEVDGEITAVAKSIAHRISKSISNIEKSTLSVEEIQDAVEDKLMASNRKDVARAYVRFRYKKEMLRHANTTDKSILALLDGTNNYLKKENSNKNADLNTTIRDYMAGEVSKDISRRILLPQDVVEAHDEAVIHFHDADYYAQHMHNCFNKDTEFVTSEGIKSFKDFSDGDKVIVLDKDGIFREATVHSYGQQKMYEVTFVTENEEKIVVCTRDHRWILRDETVTTHLSVGDVLIGNKEWTVSYISPSEVEEAWCVEEPVTHSFTLEGCMVTGNCDLVNLEDMLQNGTVISDTLIEKPHSFSTACNIATQIIAQVASAQYGGQSVSLAHLAPFVDISRQKIRKEVIEEFVEIATSLNKEDEEMNQEVIDRIVEKRVRKEVAKGVQTIQYQVVTLMTTNGQAPFLTVFMYLNEAKNEQEKADLAMIIEETLKQRIQGVKNEVGVWVTPAFPKLIYVLEEDNVEEDSKYFYLTELSAKCSVRRLVPDYISEKVMKELKEGNCFPVMGCVDGKEIITYRFLDRLYVESFERMWDRLSDNFEVKHQYVSENPNLYMDLTNVEIYDTEKGFVNTSRIIRNISDKWVDVHMSNGRRLLCTIDHPFEIQNKGVVKAENLTIGDKLFINSNQFSDERIVFNNDKAWFLGFMLCDGCYQNNSLFASIASSGEEEIEEKFINVVNKHFGLKTESILLERGKKGNYKDLRVRSDNNGSIQKINSYLNSKFGGVNKINRHIPSEVFEWDYGSKLSFLAGMIDADGYINPTTHSGSVVQLGSTNKELALQQMALAQSLGMPAKLYHNHYSKKNHDLIRYRVEFHPIEELLSYIVCNKKINNYTVCSNGFYNTIAEIIEIIPVEKIDYSYDVTTDSEHFEVSGVYSHNCRSALNPWKDENGEYKFYARFNQGVVTLNLPDVALSSGGDIDKFWQLMDERTELCHKALKCRHERLEGTPSNVAPILWQHGALGRLKKDEPIDELLHGGYSSISLGYAGLYECVKYMTGNSHTDNGIGEEFGLKVMTYLNDKCDKWTEEENVGYSIYGTPLESTTYKFAKGLKKRFGVIEGITDRDYITNSYHVPVFENIDAFTKLKLESKFQALSKGGAISYVEVGDLTQNEEVAIQLIRFIYNNIMYAELNSKSDYCMECGYNGEIKLIEENGELIWECPNCKNRNHDTLDVTRRTCGLTN